MKWETVLNIAVVFVLLTSGQARAQEGKEEEKSAQTLRFQIRKDGSILQISKEDFRKGGLPEAGDEKSLTWIEIARIADKACFLAPELPAKEREALPMKRILAALRLGRELNPDGLMTFQPVDWNRNEGVKIHVEIAMQREIQTRLLNGILCDVTLEVLVHPEASLKSPFQLGGECWTKWNVALKETLVPLQSREGCLNGSWLASGPNKAKGRLLATAFNVLTLEVSYRYGRMLGK